MATPPPTPLLQQLLDGEFSFYRIVEGNRWFVLLIVGSLAAAWVTHPYPGVAMWVGFLLAGYATIANDSIQTIGTFLASNRERAWWQLWIFIGGIFLATVTWSCLNHGGDVSYERLTAKGFAEAPTSFYAILLFAFKEISVVPMSTTWVFIGLLAGREFGMGLARHGASGLDRRTARLMGKDLLYAGIGLAVSLLLAVAANPALFFGP